MARSNLTKYQYVVKLWEHFTQAGISQQYQQYLDFIEAHREQRSPDDLAGFVQNLDNAFAETTKKFHISPVLWVFESDEELESKIECAICYENTKILNTVTLNCGHQFCGTCIMNTCKTQPAHNPPSCALCRTTMNTFVVKDEAEFEMVEQYCFI
jgi:hypothetical protein